MGSVVPLQDLNFFPDPTAAAATTTTTTTASSAANTAIKIPKLEPKLEPWDEPHISSPIPNFNESNPNYSEENNVYSEFYRVSELFRTAFDIFPIIHEPWMASGGVISFGLRKLKWTLESGTIFEQVGQVSASWQMHECALEGEARTRDEAEDVLLRSGFAAQLGSGENR
ncbi:hypothetical protein Acr_15g0001250 [Actinidia rufa]|uniref:Uncharacterized protein n=1 Tax=Actinidia rufa TaxID=165716 RepID=A0A7J0FS25_9ERIC|nr:hypothetical protein Acr_15g0001250 [Actinidia rufa]